MYQAIGGIVVFVGSMFWGAAWSGFTLSTLWGWFVAPLFGLPILSVAYAFGLALVVRSANGVKKDGKKSEKTMTQQMVEQILFAPFISGVLLLAGYIAKQFI